VAVSEDPTLLDRLGREALARYPDYEAGRPPRLLALHRHGYLDEYERIWGRRWGAMGIGRLRTVGLIRPNPAWEGHPFWAQDPNFFLLRYRQQLDPDLMRRAHEEYVGILTALGVEILWMEFQDPVGAWGPMRKLFMAEEVKIVRGGAILPRFGHASFKRGLEREFQRFLTAIGCPILLTVHGQGICEVAPMFVQMADDAWVGGLSCAANQDGLDQVLPVLRRAGVTDVHVMQLTTILDSFDAGGEFHVDMIVHPVAERLALVYPRQLPWETYRWLKERGFTLIEVPTDEHHQFVPANLVVVEPGVVIMHPGARRTRAALEAHGVKVIPFDSSGVMQGGTNGIKCITMELDRDDGPRLHA
jgi:N-dimethylarginine dimethylaminohydrolase